MVATPVPKFELKGLGSQGFAYKLMPQAYAHHRLSSNKLLYRVYYIVKENRIAGAWGEDDAIGI
jgi:hypothetical protein